MAAKKEPVNMWPVLVLSYLRGLAVYVQNMPMNMDLDQKTISVLLVESLAELTDIVFAFDAAVKLSKITEAREAS